MRKEQQNAAKETVESEPAQIVGVGELCGKLDLSVQFLHSHDVFWTFVPHFTGPEGDNTESIVSCTALCFGAKLEKISQILILAK